MPAGSSKLRPRAARPRAPTIHVSNPPSRSGAQRLHPPPRLGFGRLPKNLPRSATTGNGEARGGRIRHRSPWRGRRRWQEGRAHPWDGTPPWRWSSFSTLSRGPMELPSFSAGFGKLRPRAARPRAPTIRASNPPSRSGAQRLHPPPWLGFGRLPKTSSGSATTGNGEARGGWIRRRSPWRGRRRWLEGRAHPWDGTPPWRWSSFLTPGRGPMELPSFSGDFFSGPTP